MAHVSLKITQPQHLISRACSQSNVIANHVSGLLHTNKKAAKPTNGHCNCHCKFFFYSPSSNLFEDVWFGSNLWKQWRRLESAPQSHSLGAEPPSAARLGDPTAIVCLALMADAFWMNGALQNKGTLLVPFFFWEGRHNLINGGFCIQV
jgi:hypothetical protein